MPPPKNHVHASVAFGCFLFFAAEMWCDHLFMSAWKWDKLAVFIRSRHWPHSWIPSEMYNYRQKAPLSWNPSVKHIYKKIIAFFFRLSFIDDSHLLKNAAGDREIWVFAHQAVNTAECDSWWQSKYLPPIFKRYTKNLLSCQGANGLQLHYSAHLWLSKN